MFFIAAVLVIVALGCGYLFYEASITQPTTGVYGDNTTSINQTMQVVGDSSDWIIGVVIIFLIVVVGIIFVKVVFK